MFSGDCIRHLLFISPTARWQAEGKNTADTVTPLCGSLAQVLGCLRNQRVYLAFPLTVRHVVRCC